MSIVTLQDAELIEETLANIDETEGDADDFVRIFYDHLFETTDLQPMFHGDMKRQGKLLFSMLIFVVKYINDTETLTARLKDLGVR